MTVATIVIGGTLLIAIAIRAGHNINLQNKYMDELTDRMVKGEYLPSFSDWKKNYNQKGLNRAVIKRNSKTLT